MSQTIQSAAIFTAVAKDRAAGQQIVNLPQICRDWSQLCRNVFQVATYFLAAANYVSAANRVDLPQTV